MLLRDFAKLDINRRRESTIPNVKQLCDRAN